MDRFVDPAFLQRLVSEFPGFDSRNARNEMGQEGRKAVVPGVRKIGPAYREFDALMRSREFLRWLGEITSIGDLLYDPEYIGGGTHENLDGQELDFHVDFNFHPHRGLHRRLNLILFLNPQWNAEWGGSLELAADPWDRHQDAPVCRVVPLANRCVVFETTETSWHGFSRIRLPEEGARLSRRSIAVYFYTKERPAAETAAPHGTIYVPRGLPDRLREGYMLQQSDIDELEILMARRDQQIRFLYEREQQFSRVLEGMARTLRSRVARVLGWPLRRLRRD